MSKFYGQHTCALNISEYFPDTYNNITHTTIATMLAKEDNLSETHSIQISSCHRFSSICFTNREILLKFCDTELLLIPNTYVHLESDYHTRIVIPIENIPKELSDKEVKIFLSKMQQ